ncbi:CRISPR system precrRNA processing endoribonuclease RAMP protein Cas6 [candidate division KSB1 bacterium]|nr:CRISPR system precrRNA processing endoribonuclease RAMP protein Cas6 [candidate division KSB1 bacterium]
MPTSPIPFSLLRYLIVWKANSSLVSLSRYFPIELSFVLGTIIANRLATHEAGPWHKALAPLAEYYAEISAKNQKVMKPFPATAWPIETVLLPYPSKRAFGKDELILWELKLLGESADHGLFLELILPAMEEAGYTADTQWNRPNRLWGHFEINAVYVAKGERWEPLVTDGRLDLRYRPTPIQWAEGLTFTAPERRTFRSLNWLTTVDLSENIGSFHSSNKTPETLHVIPDALITRASRLIPGRHKSREGVMAILNAEEQASLQRALEESARLQLLHNNLQPAPANWPGAWSGTQTYAPIPAALIPYLELASILHIGKHTHFGCGTFKLS